MNEIALGDEPHLQPQDVEARLREWRLSSWGRIGHDRLEQPEGRTVRSRWCI